MLRLCNKCGVPLRSGDAIKATVYVLYEELKSKVHYAISKPFDCDPDTLVHIDCENTKDE